MISTSVTNREISHIDMLGQRINIGDWVVYGAGSGDSSVIKLCRVTNLVAPAVDAKYDVNKPAKIQGISLHCWGARFEIQNNGYPVTLGLLSRVVVIHTYGVPLEVQHGIAQYWREAVDNR